MGSGRLLFCRIQLCEEKGVRGIVDKSENISWMPLVVVAAAAFISALDFDLYECIYVTGSRRFGN